MADKHDKSYAKSIELPTAQIFRNLKSARHFAIDIGGSLAKLAYLSTVARKRSVIKESIQSNGREVYQISEDDELCDQLHFIKFETKYIEHCLDFIQDNLIGSDQYMYEKSIKVTGGGAYKYKNLISSKLNVEVDKEDEMACLIKGCNFLLKNIPAEAFRYVRDGNPVYQFIPTGGNGVFPYLLVNIGSGVSILKVEGEEKYERIGGTSLGGGTFWGLGSILTKAKGFDELLDLAQQGDHRQVDMLVKDIYGGAYSTLGLPAELIASSFGKAARSPQDSSQRDFTDADMAKSLLICISNDIGQIATLHAKLQGLKKIIFGGYFIRGHPNTMHTISYAVNYWSKGEVDALFLRHEGYLGAIGAFLKGVEEDQAIDQQFSWSDSTTWGENYAGSSGLQSPKNFESVHVFPTRERSISFDYLELDRTSKPLSYCPLLLDHRSYIPDVVDLTKDHDARNYWLQCFEDANDKFVAKAVKSQPVDKADAHARGEQFRSHYIERLRALKQNPWAYGSLTVRSLLDMREHYLEEFDFGDPYLHQKQKENDYALKFLAQRLSDLDSMEWEEKHLSLAKGLLAGNVFDWGAKEVVTLMEDDESFGFDAATKQIQPRPWLFDDYDSWLQRMRGAPHKCAVIFVDNSGIDIVLGIFPFVRELLSRGTNVILCANTRPALNDVTYNELTLLANRVAEISPQIKTALSPDTTTGKLYIMETGQSSPCLDLSRLAYDLSQTMIEQKVDLVVVEGMGRAIHTNLYAAFSCEALKVAVLKNSWLARQLGGEVFNVMFKYESPRRVIGAT